MNTFLSKTCDTCKIDKSVSEFHKHKLTKDRLRSTCKSCRSRKLREWRATHPELVKAQNKRSDSTPKRKASKPIRDKIYRDKPLTKQKRQANRQTNKHNRFGDWYTLKYGITRMNYDLMHQKQAGKCYICRNVNKSGRRLSIDHNHSTGKVRSLLCTNCNFLLGFAKENQAILLSAIDYLKHHESETTPNS